MRRAAWLSHAALLTIVALVAPRSAGAQPYARFAVPDSARVHAIAAARADYESAWNALLVSEIRATLAKADSAKRLATLERDVAAAEPMALGSRIAPDALALRKRWKKDQLRARVEAAVAESLATAARAARAYERADSLLHQALDRYPALKEKRREAWVLGSLGANALVAGNSAGAAAYYDRALAARRALGDSLLIGNTLADLGQTWIQLGQYDRAYPALQEAAALRAAQRRWAPLGNTLNFLALTLAARGQPDSADACYRRSLALTSGAGDSARTLVTLMNYGVFLIDQARLDEARAVIERASALAAQQNAYRQLADAENNLGYLDRTAGHYAQALEHFDRAIEYFEALGLPALQTLSESRKGLTLIYTGETEEARRVLQKAGHAADSLGDRVLLAKVLSTQAIAAQELADPGEAERLATRAFEAASATFDSAAIHDAAALLGYLAVERRDAPAAERPLMRAAGANASLPIETRVSDTIALATARQLLGRLDEAEAGHRAALELARSNGLLNQTLWALCCLGDVDERRGQPRAALDHYGQAVAIAETLRVVQRTERGSIALFASRLFMFEAMIHLMGKLDAAEPDSGWGARAFEWAERARARAFLDLVAASGAHDSAGAPGTPPAPPAILTLRQAQQRLLDSDREALLEYSVGDSSTTLWVIRRDRWKRFTLPPRSALQARVQALRRGLADPRAAGSRVTQRLLRGLYAQLVAPAEPLLANVDRVIVAPDGPLSLIPFEALLARDPPASGAPAPGSYVVERWALAYTPSASVLATRVGGASGTAVVAIGNPDFGAPDSSSSEPRLLAPLPSTAAEIEALRAVAGKRELATLTGKDASRARTLALAALPRAEIVHFATHGDVNEAEPERSGLWLAPDPGGGGPSRLEVADVLGLDLHARLVTLSACETGLGRLESGEGVVGLSRAFMAAGARSVMVSLWPVNDRSTADLMSRFYRLALAARPSRSDVALAAAKRALLANAETRAPFYWAPFVLVGDAAN